MPQLRSLVLHVDQGPRDSLFALFCRTFEVAINGVEVLHSGNSPLEQLEIHIHMSDPSDSPPDRIPRDDPVSLASLLLEDPILSRCKALEHALLRLDDRSPHLTIMIHLPSLWTPLKAVLRTMEQGVFPGLSRKGLLNAGCARGASEL